MSRTGKWPFSGVGPEAEAGDTAPFWPHVQLMEKDEGKFYK
jgi:hypothetical protein